MTNERETRIQAIFENKGPVIRSIQLRKEGIGSRDIQTLLDSKKLVRLKEGYYAWHDRFELLSDSQVALSVIPGATLYFLSAAEFHGLTTIIPNLVYVSVPNKGLVPNKPAYPPIEITQFSIALYNLGRTVEERDGFMFSVYNRERTICDFMKRWDEVGKDTVLESIRNYMAGPRDIQKLYECAEKLRIRHLIHPYIEALV